jgi:hypothetical protein
MERVDWPAPDMLSKRILVMWSVGLTHLIPTGATLAAMGVTLNGD